MNETLRCAVKSLYHMLPDTARVNIDFYLRSKLRNVWGGPFNGQARRLELVKRIFVLCHFECIVETGTFRASTTEYFAQTFSKTIYSCDMNNVFYRYAQKRLKKFGNVLLSKSNSVEFLRDLSRLDGHGNAPIFFYLDAHWMEYLPLRKELEIIVTAMPNSVIMIDDFQVLGDPGYQYDDYGPGKALNLEYLEPLRDSGFFLFAPSAPSRKETGFKRGCIVLTKSEEFAEALRGTDMLKYLGPSVAVLANQ